MIKRILLIISLLCVVFSFSACKKGQSRRTAANDPNAEFKFVEPVTIIVPFTAGGPTDRIVRAIQPYVAKNIGVNVVIENINGAGGAIGTMTFLSRPGDGYTVLFGAPTNIIYRPLSSGTDYAYGKDLQAVSEICSMPLTLCVKSDSPFKSPEDLFTYMRQNPEKFTYANSGSGSITDVAFQELLFATGLKAQGVPFQGTANGYSALMGNHVQGLVCNASEAKTKDGIRILINLGSDIKMPGMENIPSARSLGYKDVSTDTFFGFYYRDDVPANAVKALDDAVNKALQDPECVKKIHDINQNVSYKNSKEFDQYVKKTIESTRTSLAKMNLLAE
jgi:tripartite-type tricarboxylate transporter receptor subunit TctC